MCRPNGPTIQAILNDTPDIETMPKVGDVVTLQFSGYGKKTEALRSPRIFLVRPDLKWKDVIAENKLDSINEPLERYLPGNIHHLYFILLM